MYHLYWSHRQFQLEPVFERVTSFLGLFVMTGDPLSFARTHRWHHAHADTDLDTHSPVHGRFHSMIGWLFKKSPVNGVLIPDLTTEEFKYLKFLAREKIKLIWATLIVIALISREALLGLTLTMCIAFHLEMITNAFAHSPKTKSAMDVKILAWLTFGVLHLGHHNNPGKIERNDPGYLLIRSLRKLRLVR